MMLLISDLSKAAKTKHAENMRAIITRVTSYLLQGQKKKAIASRWHFFPAKVSTKLLLLVPIKTKKNRKCS